VAARRRRALRFFEDPRRFLDELPFRDLDTLTLADFAEDAALGVAARRRRALRFFEDPRRFLDELRFRERDLEADRRRDRERDDEGDFAFLVLGAEDIPASDVATVGARGTEALRRERRRLDDEARDRREADRRRGCFGVPALRRRRARLRDLEALRRLGCFGFFTLRAVEADDAARFLFFRSA